MYAQQIGAEIVKALRRTRWKIHKYEWERKEFLTVMDDYRQAFDWCCDQLAIDMENRAPNGVWHVESVDAEHPELGDEDGPIVVSMVNGTYYWYIIKKRAKEFDNVRALTKICAQIDHVHGFVIEPFDFDPTAVVFPAPEKPAAGTGTKRKATT